MNSARATGPTLCHNPVCQAAAGLHHLLLALVAAAVLALLPAALRAEVFLPQFLTEVAAGTLVPGADGYGPVRGDVPVAPVLKGGQTIGWAFITSDFVGTTGYSGKPIHVLMALDPAAHVIGTKLVKHSEPIVLIGIPQARIEAVLNAYVGLDLVAVANGAGHDLKIVSGPP